MRYLLYLLITFFISSTTFSQTNINLKDASKHIGDSVKICGKVFSARFFENAKDSPTLLNLGAAYPDQLLTVVIRGDLRKEFETAPEIFFNDKEICVTGKIELYKDKPEIIVKGKGQIVIIK